MMIIVVSFFKYTESLKKIYINFIEELIILMFDLKYKMYNFGPLLTFYNRRWDFATGKHIVCNNQCDKH